MTIVRFAVRLRVMVTPVAISRRSTVVRVPMIPVVVVPRVPDRIDDQRRDIHTRVHIDGCRRRLWFDGVGGCRGGRLGVGSHVRSAWRRRCSIHDFLGPRLRPTSVVEHPPLTVPVPARRNEDHVLDLVDPLATLPFELLASPYPMTGEPVVRCLRKHLRGRLQLFEILGRLGVRRPFVGSAYGRRLGRWRILRWRWHVFRDLVPRSNIVTIGGFLSERETRNRQGQ